MEPIDLSQLPDEDQPDKRDEDDPGEVPTSFATKGVGWSGRDKQDDTEGPA
jgi:hypothetical protein